MKVLPLQLRRLENPGTCDICGRARSYGNHQKCSKKRQAMNAWKWKEEVTHDKEIAGL